MKINHVKLKEELLQIIEKIQNNDYSYFFFMNKYPEFSILIKEEIEQINEIGIDSVDEIFNMIQIANDLDFDRIKDDIQQIFLSNNSTDFINLKQMISTQEDISDIYANAIKNYDLLRNSIEKAIYEIIPKKTLNSSKKAISKMREVDFMKYVKKMMVHVKNILKKMKSDQYFKDFLAFLKLDPSIKNLVDLIQKIESYDDFIINIISQIIGIPIKKSSGKEPNKFSNIGDFRHFIQCNFRQYPVLSKFFLDQLSVKYHEIRNIYAHSNPRISIEAESIIIPRVNGVEYKLDYKEYLKVLIINPLVIRECVHQLRSRLLE